MQSTETIQEEQPRKTCSECWEKHHCRKGYFHTEQAFDECCIECDKPGIGSKDFQGGSGNCPLLCLPCAIIADLFCCIPITFGYYTVEKPN
jgi:hypothetical protein